MKIKYLEQIMARIQQEIYCPKCKNPFKKEGIEVLGVKGNHVDFASHCYICGAHSQISAKIGGSVLQKMKASGKKAVAGVPFHDGPLTEHSVVAVTKKLKYFRGRDVKQLFE